MCPNCGRLVGVREERCFNCGRRNPGLWGFHQLFQALGRDLGFTKIAIGGCSLIYLFALMIDPSQIMGGGNILGILAPSFEANLRLGATGGALVFGYHHWWTVLSAMWLHGGLLHIGFNLYWIYQLSPAVSHLYGPARSILIYVVSSAIGFTATSAVYAYGYFLPGFLHGAQVTVGASAAILGWLGALVYYGKRSGSTHLSRQMWGLVLPLFVLGLILPVMDNWAHVGGFAGGYLMGKMLDPLRPERVDHVVLALLALLASFAAVGVSFVVGVPR